jgi:cation transport ATPase
MRESGAAPRVTVGRDALTIQSAPLFAADAASLSRRFAQRALGLPEVRALGLKPAVQTATLHFGVADGERGEFLERLAAVIGGGPELEDERIPFWPPDEPVTLYRYGDFVSTYEVLSARAGRLQLRHAALARDPALARRVEDALRTLAGVRAATVTRSTGKLWIAFDVRIVAAQDLIRAAERPPGPTTAAVPPPLSKPVDFRQANTSVGLATAGEFLVPLATPLCAGFLAATKFDTLRDAAGEVRRGRLGTPVWLTARLASAVASGQVLSYALIDWSFRYWSRRWRRDATAQIRVLHQDTVPLPSLARRRTDQGVETHSPVEELRPGQSIIATAGEAIAVDGRVTMGAALVQETPLSGIRAAVRKTPGDPVYAGSAVIEGRIGIEVLHAGADTLAARISAAVGRAATTLPDDPALERAAIRLNDRTVPRTLAMAGVGLAVGDLLTASIILHQDWMNGAQLAVPLQTLRDLRLAAATGVVVRNPDALQRLAESRFVVIEDQPALHRRRLALHAIRSNLPETDKLLVHVASAGQYLGDERAAALEEACRERGLVIRRSELQTVEPEAVTVRAGKHRIALRGAFDPGEDSQRLLAEVDGVEAAWFEFRRTGRRQAADALERLKALGAEVFLVSTRPEAEAAALAAEIGSARFSGGLKPEQQVRFLQGLRHRGVRATWVGGRAIDPAPHEAAHVSIALGGGLLEDGPADIVVAGEQLDAVADVMALSRENAARIRQLTRSASAPNLLCIVGGYLGLLNGFTAGILATLAVLNVYRAATKALHAPPEPSRS